MREIEFRIIFKGKTYYWGYIKGGFSGIPVDNCGLNIELAKKLSCQYTGLKDKKGKKIFEGDIVKSYHSCSSHEIRYIKECGGYVFYDKNIDYAQEEQPNYLRYDINGNTKKYKILGNIHENPELIKET